MKNKEESFRISWRGSHWPTASSDVADQTTGSLSRPGRTATALREKPALSWFARR